jgi:hypothetical protein
VEGGGGHEEELDPFSALLEGLEFLPRFDLRAAAADCPMLFVRLAPEVRLKTRKARPVGRAFFCFFSLIPE